MAMDDNNTTGRFLDQSFSVVDVKLAPGDDPIAPLNNMLADGVRFFIVDLPAPEVLAVADAARASGALVFNAGAPDDRLREEDCRANVIHTAPTRSMLADGLAQYLIWKQWRRWLLVVGSHPEDKLLAEAYRRSAKKFGAKIVEERVYEDTGGGRRSDSGSVQVQRQMPVFTQSAPDYDVLVAADESQVFAGYLPYRTWDPAPRRRLCGFAADKLGPLARALGRRAVAKPLRAPVQARHECARQPGLGRHAHDRRRGRAYPLGRSQDDLRRSPVARLRGRGFQGREANVARLEPAIASAHPADRRPGHGLGFPQEGFLHETSELDTLGFDKPETKCKLQ